MGDEKRSGTNWNIANTLGLAIAIPIIIYKVARAIYLKSVYGNLNEKVVVITGASSGLGEALAHEFYQKGCQLVLCARRKQELDRVRTDILKTHSTMPARHPIVMPLDLSDTNSLSEAANKILAIAGHIDILINNAGVAHRGLVVNTKIEVDLEIMKVNYFGTVALTKAFLPNMIDRRQGHIMNISSVQGLIALPERSAYGASKHALHAFSDTMRAELSKYNIQVCVASPGYIRTQLSQNALTATGERYAKTDPTTEAGYSPEYVARQIVNAIVHNRKEIVIAPVMPQIAIFLRKYLPSIYFYVMNKRAQ